MGVNFGSVAGYLWLDTWVMSHIVYLATERFCQHFLDERNDPKGRLYDQMVLAARSAPANIAEGTSRLQTSTETAMRLVDVARATINELASDYLHWILSHDALCWSKYSPEWNAVQDIRLERAIYGEDLMRDVSAHITAQRERFKLWTEADDSIVCANSLLILCARLNHMLSAQLKSQLAAFRTDGGFTENLTQERREAVQQQAATQSAPSCPLCGKPMRRRHGGKGAYLNHEFWGCTAFPQCRGTREITS